MTGQWRFTAAGSPRQRRRPLSKCRLPDGRVLDLGSRAGRVAEIGGLTGRAAAREIHCVGRAVTPGLGDAHILLDKAFLSDRASSREGRWPRPSG